VAEAAAVTKRTLYNHFGSKDALVGQVLERQQVEMLGLVRGWAGGSAATGAALIAAIFDGLERWAAQPRWLGSGYTRLALELADLPGHPARRVARAHKRAVEAFLAGELARLDAPAPEETARQLMMLIEGCMCLMLIHGDRSYAATAARASMRLTARCPWLARCGRRPRRGTAGRRVRTTWTAAAGCTPPAARAPSPAC
jgi:AcrR family transcriptional regulator